MIGRDDPQSSTYERTGSYAERGRLSANKGKLLLLAALLLVFAGIAMVDHEQKRVIADQNRYDSSYPIDLASVYGPSTLLGSTGNFYPNEPLGANDSNRESMREFDNAITVQEATALSHSAPIWGADEVAGGALALRNAKNSPSANINEDSASLKDTKEGTTTSVEKATTAAAPVVAATAIKNSFRNQPPRRRVAKKRQYRRNSKVLTVRNLTPRRYTQRPIAIESRTETVYATVYPRKRRTVLGTAGKIITAPVKLLLSPFKRKEYYD